jgi:DNA (cytosine-5)-methyltransferase 1
LGDITKINGADIEPVDIISFGSPCQDLSISGKRAGLEGGRSGLFNEALRVIKEMRIATNGIYPTGIIWENVPGAFSSNGGRDFHKVIQKIAEIAEPGISIPRPTGKFRWLASGAILGNCFSLAWRTLDAQYWGVPSCSTNTPPPPYLPCRRFWKAMCSRNTF